MLKINQITSDARQKMSVVLPDGSFFDLTIYFVPLQLGWFIEEFVYRDFVLHGMRICNNSDMLYQQKNKLKFGLACFTDGNREPSLQQDFSSGASNLYVVTADEVTAYSESLRG